MSDEPENYREQPPESQSQEIHEAIGQSDSFLEFQERLSRVAQVNRPVLLVGERGTGKELAAQRIHFLSRRWDSPFITLNCSALSPTLIESELFGHEAGAYTGAGSRRAGRFEAASEGTLFLDEIGNIPLEVQGKILRVVEYGVFERVGSTQSIQVDVRIVGATNVDLQAKADAGLFMTDLLDRLSFDVLILPPMRERVEDVAVLANHFAARMGHELGWASMPEITAEAMETLEKYLWPGNVRELKNVVERAVYRSDDFIITREELIFDPFRAFSERLLGTVAPEPVIHESFEKPAPPSESDQTFDFSVPLSDAVRSLELGMLREGLERAKFNQRKAAELLGLTYHQFRGLYRKYQEDLDA